MVTTWTRQRVDRASWNIKCCPNQNTKFVSEFPLKSEHRTRTRITLETKSPSNPNHPRARTTELKTNFNGPYAVCYFRISWLFPETRPTPELKFLYLDPNSICRCPGIIECVIESSVTYCPDKMNTNASTSSKKIDLIPVETDIVQHFIITTNASILSNVDWLQQFALIR